jgi:hypothetical protein
MVLSSEAPVHVARKLPSLWTEARGQPLSDKVGGACGQVSISMAPTATGLLASDMARGLVHAPSVLGALGTFYAKAERVRGLGWLRLLLPRGCSHHERVCSL